MLCSPTASYELPNWGPLAGSGLPLGELLGELLGIDGNCWDLLAPPEPPDPSQIHGLLSL